MIEYWHDSRRKWFRKNKLLDIVATGVTVISEGTSAGPFNNANEMKKKFEELNVNGYDKVGEKSDEVSM